MNHADMMNVELCLEYEALNRAIRSALSKRAEEVDKEVGLRGFCCVGTAILPLRVIWQAAMLV